MSPRAISFKGIFPYLRARVGLSARNLFHKAVDVTSVNSDLDDPRVYFEEGVDGLPRLRPTEKVEVIINRNRIVTVNVLLRNLFL